MTETADWDRIQDVESWRKTKTKSRSGHAWRTYARRKNSTVGFNWEVCRACGLVKLKNAASERAARSSCDAKEEQ